MNPGSEPERDDTGLPPVDIEIPDDARELDRDVQAYYRELRAHRRHLRSRRLRGIFGKDGIVLPLLACCLILALITGTLLTVFSATSDVGRIPGPGRPTAGSSGSAAQSAASSATSARVAHGRGTAVAQSASAAAGSSPARSASGGSTARTSSSAATGSSRSAAASAAPGAASAGAAGTSAGGAGAGGASSNGPGAAGVAGASVGAAGAAGASAVPTLVRSSGLLPDGTLRVGGGAVPLRSLQHAVLVLVPPRCGCGITVARLAGLAGSVRAPAYLIGTPTAAAEVASFARQLAGRAGLRLHVATDLANSLRDRYPHTGLTAIVVAPNKQVSVATNVQPGDNLTGLARSLAR